MRKALEFDMHGATGRGELGLHFARNGGIDAGEDDLRRALRIGRRQRHFGDALGQRRVETPLGGFAVGLAAGPVAGRKPGYLKPRMVFEQLDVTLADHSGGAEDADWSLFFIALIGIFHQCLPGKMRLNAEQRGAADAGRKFITSGVPMSAPSPPICKCQGALSDEPAATDGMGATGLRRKGVRHSANPERFLTPAVEGAALGMPEVDSESLSRSSAPMSAKLAPAVT